MNRRVSIYWLAPLIAAAMLAMSRQVEAADYPCGGPWNGICFSGTTTAGNNTANFTSNGATAVNAADTNGGTGVSGTTTTGWGVTGTATGTDGYGVAGYASGGDGAIGVLGKITNVDGQYAIYGDDEVNSSGWHYAGYFHGTVDVAGCFQVGGVNEFGCSSDERLKKNIEPLKGSLDRLLELKGVTYEWKDPAAQGNQTGTQTGFIAQGVEKVFPKWVGANRDGFKTLTISQTQIEALIVEAFRETKTKSDALQIKSDKQQAQLDRQQLQLDKQQAEIDELNHGKDPISRGPGFGAGMLALFAATAAGATGLMMKRLGLSLATVMGLLIAGRKKDDEKKS